MKPLFERVQRNQTDTRQRVFQVLDTSSAGGRWIEEPQYNKKQNKTSLCGNWYEDRINQDEVKNLKEEEEERIKKEGGKPIFIDENTKSIHNSLNQTFTSQKDFPKPNIAKRKQMSQYVKNFDKYSPIFIEDPNNIQKSSKRNFSQILKFSKKGGMSGINEKERLKTLKSVDYKDHTQQINEIKKKSNDSFAPKFSKPKGKRSKMIDQQIMNTLISDFINKKQNMNSNSNLTTTTTYNQSFHNNNNNNNYNNNNEGKRVIDFNKINTETFSTTNNRLNNSTKELKTKNYVNDEPITFYTKFISSNSNPYNKTLQSPFYHSGGGKQFEEKIQNKNYSRFGKNTTFSTPIMEYKKGASKD